jgi:arginyl-tRNA synthetase
MSNPLAELRDDCQRLLKEAAGKAYRVVELPSTKFSYPPDPEMGDLSSAVCFQMAGRVGSRPSEIAERIVGEMDPGSSGLVGKVDALNGYINFHIDTSRFTELVLETVVGQDGEYGFLKAGEPERVMVEHTSANPNAPIHIGNARNSILGACLGEMLRRRGHDVVVHFLVNDMGRQVAMATFGWKLIGTPEPEGRAEYWVGTIYASVNVAMEIRRIEGKLEEAEERGRATEIAELREEMGVYETAAEDLRKRFEGLYDGIAEKLAEVEDADSVIVELNTAYENRDPETVEDVRRLIGYCLKGFETSLGEIGIEFDSFDFESDLVWSKAADGVLEGLRATPYAFYDEGALVLDCDRIAEELNLKERWGLNPDHEIPRLVLVRSDGTTLYTLRDMAYSIWKFGMVDRVVNVIGYEQTLAQLQLRLALAALGETWMGDKQLHYAYEFVKLPGMKMSGRLGRYVTLLEVVEKAVELAYGEVDVRAPHLSHDEKQGIARMVGHGAVKYTMLSIDPMKTVVFDWDRALNFETNSAPFIQYSHARACNILKRAEEHPDPDYGGLTAAKERELVMALAGFPEVFEGAVTELKPGDVTSYANGLADRFNSFYAALPVLKAENRGLSGARLVLVDAVRITLRNALSLLGIEAPERM